MRILTFGLLCLALGCSSSDDDDQKTGTGGAGGSSSGGTGGSAGSTTGGTGGSGGQTGGAGGSAGSATGGVSGSGTGGVAGGSSSCNDSSNPMFGSCIEQLLAGCYAPDTSGTCTAEANGTTSWSDGSKFVPTGPGAGMYSPGATQPCIDVVVDNGNITATKGSDTLTYEPDSSTNTGTITCPDGSTFTATFEQVTEFNVCKGINCPGS